MTDPSKTEPERLDSWKAIAAYLSRDERTIRRWERELGLPIRRVSGGRGRSVFAYKSEIDAWVRTPPPDKAETRRAEPETLPRPRRRWPIAAAIATAIILITGFGWRVRAKRAAADDFRLQTMPDGIVAFDANHGERWRFPFPADTVWSLPQVDMAEPSQVMGGAHPAVYVATHVGVRRSDSRVASGSLLWLDTDGVLQHAFSFDDAVTFHGATFAAPWAITSFAVDDSGGRRRIAVAAHHSVWNASLVTVLDDRWQRHGTFVHDGWIEAVRWLAPDRLLVAGFSNAHDGAMLALLDPTRPAGVDGQGPETPGSPAYCDTCASAAPLRMVVMPRTDVNRATVSPFNRAMIQVSGDRVLARTMETPSEGAAGYADAIYEFTRSLDLIGASFSDRYREVRHALERQGKLPAKPASSDRPREVQVWTPETGWRTQTVR